MAIIHIKRIKTALVKLFGDQIDMSDYDSRPVEEKEKAFLSRALCCYALTLESDCTQKEAAEASTDGFDDNGIDLVWFDKHGLVLYVGQSKWIENGKGSISLGDCKKFVDGFRDLVNLRLERFNPKLRAKQNDLEAALLDANVQVRLLLTHSGTQPISDHVKRDLDGLLDEMNDPVELISLEVFDQSGIYEGVSGHAQRKSINLEIMLREWGHLDHPYIAYYGQVNAASIAQWWAEHDQNLFARNIRSFKGSTDVNAGVSNAIRQEAEHFWYYNNGLTILCAKIGKKPLGGASRESGIFDCQGVSIVNGAQTVGIIGKTIEAGNDNLEKAKVLVRLISLEGCPEGFDKSVTRATNTQNRIERRDFAALDPNQSRLASELLLDGKRYAFKSGDVEPAADEGCSIVDATVALACAADDLSLAIQAKREIGRLWEDIEGAPYTDLFSDSTSATTLWRSVTIMRAVDSKLKQITGLETGRAEMVAIHGNRFILHQVFKHEEVRAFRADKADMDTILKTASNATTLIHRQVTQYLDTTFPGAYLASFFKNLNKCRLADDYLSTMTVDDSEDDSCGSEVSGDDSSGQKRLF